MKILKLEAGKYYKTKIGRKVKIIATDVKEACLHNVGVELYSGGAVLYDKYGNTFLSYLNIVSEWEEPFELDFSWSTLPAWADKYIAKDENGQWFCFEVMPKKNERVYGPQSDTFGKIPQKYHPKNFAGNWKESLFMNPKYKQDEN